MLYVLGTKMRNAIMAAIYRKCLRLSNAALQVRVDACIVCERVYVVQENRQAVLIYKLNSPFSSLTCTRGVLASPTRCDVCQAVATNVPALKQGCIASASGHALPV